MDRLSIFNGCLTISYGIGLATFYISDLFENEIIAGLATGLPIGYGFMSLYKGLGNNTPE